MDYKLSDRQKAEGEAPLCSFPSNNCTLKDHSVKFTKFAEDMIIGLIKESDESAYRWEVAQLALWCSQNNRELNTLTTVKVTVDPLHLTVSAVETFRFSGIHSLPGS